MEENRFLMVSIDDEKSKEIAEVLGSKTCRKIISHLSENKEASQKDISDSLKIPMNTLDYNMKKLVNSGFVRKKSNFFWSRKGKKIAMYELSNKSVIISSGKSSLEKIKSIIPSLILAVSGAFVAFAIERIFRPVVIFTDSVPEPIETYSLAESGARAAMEVAASQTTQIIPPGFWWAWFLAGALIAIITFSVVNWRKI